MQNSRSIWESHEGSTSQPRQRPTARATHRNKTKSTDNANSHEVGDDICNKVTEALESSSLDCEGDEEENEPWQRISWSKRQPLQFSYTSSEGGYSLLVTFQLKSDNLPPSNYTGI